jgi:cytochrome P450 family 709
MGLPWLAVAAVLASWAFNMLVWRPYSISRKLRAQGLRGPGYKFFVGNLAEIKRLRADAVGHKLDVGDHDFIPIVQPHFRKWIPLYGTLAAGYRSVPGGL